MVFFLKDLTAALLTLLLYDSANGFVISLFKINSWFCQDSTFKVTKILGMHTDVYED